ncbi:hypothetical protein PAT3040_05776 [Paenibacillus agaridevorans]|uniref:Lipocalin-like domain-containing protein n=1 Tax=Paenibacillus agaridevorans TaxID=171404 RepID=A0A2R5EZC4_9BACL|nr:hypothetical protein [Paenibacillus agaridevorans]GBG10999.1 hypothetical protein PAT3040_05776 [Paenibacillus agaridevorans]
MKKTIFLINIILLSVIVLTSCSNDIDKSIQGEWISVSASQKEGTTDFLDSFNFVNILEEEMNISYLSSEQLVDKTKRVLSSSNEKVKYELNENILVINNNQYEIEINNNEMTIKNSDIEVLYIRE